MQSDLFELYYSDGGHGGPYGDFFVAIEEAKSRIAGCPSIHAIEIRPRTSPATGGFKSGNAGSSYLSRSGVNWRLSPPR
jgi:hypothetical protein